MPPPPAPALPAPTARYQRPIRRVLIVAPTPSPTADIYLGERFTGAGVPISRVDLASFGRGRAEDGATLEDGTFVIVVRYLSRRAAARLRGAAGELAGVAYLLDDDMPAAWSSPGLAAPYRLWLNARWRLTRPLVAALASEIWLCSDGLMERYGARPGVHRIDPLYLRPPRPVRVFYHGVSSHEGEALWLRPVVAEIQARRDDILFEIIGRGAVAKAFAGIPRCAVAPPMPWPDYLSAGSGTCFDIGLAPLRPSDFNRARSHTKFFDIVRSGAAGIFADHGPYPAVVEDGRNGLLRPDDPAAWRDAILALADDADLRARLHRAAAETALALDARERANPLFDRFRAASGA